MLFQRDIETGPGPRAARRKKIHDMRKAQALGSYRILTFLTGSISLRPFNVMAPVCRKCQGAS